MTDLDKITKSSIEDKEGGIYFPWYNENCEVILGDRKELLENNLKMAKNCKNDKKN